MFICFEESYTDTSIFYQSAVILPHGRQEPGPRFNIKMTSYQYRKSHCGDKTILRPSYLHNGISYTGKMTSLYWIRALFIMVNTMAVDDCSRWPQEPGHQQLWYWTSYTETFWTRHHKSYDIFISVDVVFVPTESRLLSRLIYPKDS